MRSTDGTSVTTTPAEPSGPGGAHAGTRLWAVDAGGSRTRLLFDDGTRWEGGTANPASVDTETADGALAELLGRAARHLGGAPANGWIATASFADGDTAQQAARVAAVAARAGLTGTVVVSRDTAPPLYAPPLRGRGLVVVCGTGSAVVASSGHPGSHASVGGCEYLGSDEGSGFALGLAGLRAAVRASDGRGTPTGLGARLCAHAADPATDRARGGGDEDVRTLARRLAADPFPKRAVAALAPAVCRGWLDGDQTAARIVETALDDLTDAARAGRDGAGLTGTWRAVLVGGVFLGCPPFAEALTSRLAALGMTGRPVVPEDSAAVVLEALAWWRHAGAPPGPGGGHAVELPARVPAGGVS
ncbi:BadF/BadG/BcrA/BcrD ATPase family protein [Streptomyces sp. NPDC018347]|uniref:BadF/BadG/BcrA/BcrD ATPase family protein n=1 Tax=Streptomyces sp. NPDC018347 TaxID=3157193 RepID=UPI00340BBA03